MGEQAKALLNASMAQLNTELSAAIDAAEANHAADVQALRAKDAALVLNDTDVAQRLAALAALVAERDQALSDELSSLQAAHNASVAALQAVDLNLTQVDKAATRARERLDSDISAL